MLGRRRICRAMGAGSSNDFIGASLVVRENSTVGRFDKPWVRMTEYVDYQRNFTALVYSLREKTGASPAFSLDLV